MKKNFRVFLLAVFVAVASCSFTTKEFNDPDKDKLLVDLITYVLEKGHYDPKTMDDAFSQGVYADFIDAMDPLKRYFLASDLEDFSKYEFEIDDQLRNKELAFFDMVYNRYMKRSEEAQKYYQEILEQPFDFNLQEKINVDYDATPWVTSKSDLNM